MSRANFSASPSYRSKKRCGHKHRTSKAASRCAKRKGWKSIEGWR